MARTWADWQHNPPAVRGVPNTSNRGTKSTVESKWADWLHNPYCLGAPQRIKAGDKVSNGPQVGVWDT